MTPPNVVGVEIPPLIFSPGQRFDVFRVRIENAEVPDDWPNDGFFVARSVRIGNALKIEIFKPCEVK